MRWALSALRGEVLVRSIWSVVVLAVGFAWSSAAAQVLDEVGLLTCAASGPTDDEAGGAGSSPQTRNASCTFQQNSGGEESYVGKVQVVTLAVQQTGTLRWLVMVKASSAFPATPGLLQQDYAVNPKGQGRQTPDLVGEVNSDIVLRSVTEEGGDLPGASGKSPASGFTVLGVQLQLKSTTG
jgi:hypothetical protein